MNFHRNLRCLIPLGMLFASLCLPAQAAAGNLSAQLPDIGKAGSSVLSPREEQLLGREFMRSVQQSLDLLDDPPVVAYLQGLADRLVASHRESQAKITVFLVNDASINAFAGPGGYIGIHTGLLLNARNEGELVSVMAHEIAHVSQRHLVRAIEASNRMNLPTMGALIAAIVLGASNPEATEALIASSMAGNVQQQLTHSRSNEQEADNIGLELMLNAKYDPRNMVSFFELLQNKQRLTESVSPEFLRTHPLTLGRIADARNRAEQTPTQVQRDNSTFELMQARILTLDGKGDSATQAKTERLTWSSEAKAYFKALKNAEKGDYPSARKALNQLAHENRHRLLFPYSAAQIELADNQPQAAEALLRQALALFPGNLILTELYAETLLQSKNPQAAFDLLKLELRKHPEHIRLYPSYAKAANALNQKAEAYRALAEWQYAQGSLYQAIDYLTQALREPGLSPYDRLTLEARAEMMKAEVKEREQPVSTTGESQKNRLIF